MVLFHSLTFLSEDELQNVEMAEDEKLKKRLELKVKKHDYKGYDDEEFEEGNQGLLKRSILAKYNEEIEGSRQSVGQFRNIIVRLLSSFYQTFRLGSSTLSGKTQREDQKQQTAVALKKSLLTIDYSSKSYLTHAIYNFFICITSRKLGDK